MWRIQDQLHLNGVGYIDEVREVVHEVWVCDNMCIWMYLVGRRIFAIYGCGYGQVHRVHVSLIP